ncbi:MAG: DUF1684 domain-containing protein [Paracoccaceae bacterium]
MNVHVSWLTGYYQGPAEYQLADWRLRMQNLYHDVRKCADPRAAHALWRAGRNSLFANHPMSPVPPDQRETFEAMPVFDYDPVMRFEVDLVPGADAAFDYDLGSDGVMRVAPVARTLGLVAALGGELVVYWIEGYGGGLFLPFRDATSGHETYGGGRYIIDAIKGADLGLTPQGRLILDFNFAYTPSCALNPAFVCPLSLAANELPEPVRAGEMFL